MILKLGIIDDPGMTLTYFMPRSILDAYAFEDTYAFLLYTK